MDDNFLKERIGRLKEWKQNESVNEILFNALSALNDYTREQFDAMNSKINDEAAINISDIVIKTAVSENEHVDKQLFLYPVAEYPPIECTGYIATVFAECDYITMQKLIDGVYAAKITTKAQVLEVGVKPRYSMKYLQKLEYLYYVFSENEIPWTTVNGIYFFKFLDLFCEENIDVGEILSFEINFSEYEEYISYNKQLLWNVKNITVPISFSEPVPAYNHIQYEHCIKNLRFDEYQYLVCPLDDKFSLYLNNQNMYLRSYNKLPEQISLLAFAKGNEKDSYLYLRSKTNQRESGIINALAKSRYVPTRGEAERIIRSLKKHADFRLLDIKIVTATNENISKYKALEYNFFIENNVFLKEKKLLLFSFETNEDPLWVYEKMFYLLSELQLSFYEYRCVGEIL